MTETIAEIADELFAPAASHGLTLALVVMQSGEVCFERYGCQPDTIFGPGGPVTADTRLISWSMAKSITHAAVGLLVGDSSLHLDGAAAVDGWARTRKEAITLQHLLDMRPGLEWVEDYVDAGVSHCLEMLFGSGQHDMAGYAAALPVVAAPGSVWNYSSGTTNIVARMVGDVVGGGQAGMEAFLRDRLFVPAGMHSAVPKFDTAGTFVGSSYVYATARDFAKFGELYRHDGVVGGQRILPESWRDHARTWVADDDESDFAYGRHWWLWPDLPGSFACHGYEGQYCLVVPDLELVLVHLGKSPVEVRSELDARLRRLVAALT